MDREDILKYQEMVTGEVERLSKDKKYLSKTEDIDHKEKVNPFVVACLANENEQIIKSFRSELFNGDHAEYNLFLQKLNGEDHSSDILFVSLEPCNHDSRLTTIACSELIKKAGIKKVFMGTFDPDPMVRGDGYAYMKLSDIDVQLFEEKYQARLIDANIKFYKSKIIEDESFRRFYGKYRDNFDIDAIALDFVAKEISESIENDYFNIEAIFKKIESYKNEHQNDIYELFYNASLSNHYLDNVVINSKRDFWFDDGFKLAFFKNPNTFFKGAYFKIIVDREEGEFSPKTIQGPIFKAFLEAMLYISQKLKESDIKNSAQVFVQNIVREMLINAACHKNYNSYSPIIVKITQEAIEIYNPYVADKIDIKRMNKYNMPTNPVNGCLADIAINEHFMEGQGRGTRDLKKYLQYIGIDKYVVYESVCDILITKIPFPIN